MSAPNEELPGDEFEVIFRRWFRHHATGKIIYAPPGKVFPLRIRRKR